MISKYLKMKYVSMFHGEGEPQSLQNLYSALKPSEVWTSKFT